MKPVEVDTDLYPAIMCEVKDFVVFATEHTGRLSAKEWERVYGLADETIIYACTRRILATIIADNELRLMLGEQFVKHSTDRWTERLDPYMIAEINGIEPGMADRVPVQCIEEVWTIFSLGKPFTEAWPLSNEADRRFLLLSMIMAASVAAAHDYQAIETILNTNDTIPGRA